jgi:hypothetical protein
MTKVLFRKCEYGSIDAVFPELPGTRDPYTMTYYSHIGQHSSGYWSYWQKRSTPAQPAEYADLLAELKSIGYDDLEIIQRMPSDAIDTRRKAIQAIH